MRRRTPARKKQTGFIYQQSARQTQLPLLRQRAQTRVIIRQITIKSDKVSLRNCR